ncbi:LysE/ArgO family amino acid transporter [Bacillus sp. V5-8f]|uniref:LysE/ArgO family amino acid transporter n=1 Tax=Bacillus sp. V5-8f TaxID=2053044 RepID=UPI000C78FBBC|nr:LysE/ArgO family amino acid transporter [Bacillus sp. V5-8f]PLT34118.1 lysine transporter LysE [Bacillus sp. V5-8f]
MLEVFMHGIILAFGLILPLGAQNVFIFQQGASQPNYLRALPVVITASVCDTLLIILAVTGSSVLVLANDWFKVVLMSAGVIFLVYMGWMTWKSKPTTIDKKAEAYSFKRQMIFAATISLLNPHAIIDTIGVIGTSSLQYSGNEKLLFSLSCIAVSWTWFAFLALAGKIFSRIDTSGKLMVILNKISALIMWGIAIYLAKALILD